MDEEKTRRFIDQEREKLLQSELSLAETRKKIDIERENYDRDMKALSDLSALE
jgi:hypothetical protein